MDKEDVAHIYNGILLSHKNKRNWVICNRVDGPRVCHTEWSKWEKLKIELPYDPAIPLLSVYPKRPKL